MPYASQLLLINRTMNKYIAMFLPIVAIFPDFDKQVYRK